MAGFHRASGEVAGRRRELADRVRAELRRAGIPARLVSGTEADAAAGMVGAEVEIDDGDDAAGGVFVHWQPDPGLSHAAAEHVRTGQTDADVLRHFGSVKAHMRDAIAGVLRSAGLTAEIESDDMRPFAVRVREPGPREAGRASAG